MANIKNKTRNGVISIYHECIPMSLAADAVAIFDQYRRNGYDRDGETGGGMDKRVKDTRDMNPHSQFPVGNDFREIAQEIETHVMECIIDYYNDNTGMLYQYGPFSRVDRSTYPDPAVFTPRVFRLQHGQFQYYDTVSNGYTSNHSETMIHKDAKQTCSDYRSLTWMMTLNTLPVTEEQYGYTVFTNQNIAVRPVAGQLVLFSPYIDCEHRGNPTNGHSKTIVTAWVSSDTGQ